MPRDINVIHSFTVDIFATHNYCTCSMYSIVLRAMSKILIMFFITLNVLLGDMDSYHF